MLDLKTVKAAVSHQERQMDIPLLGDAVRVRMFKKGEVDAMKAEAMIGGQLDNDKLERLLLQRGLIEPALDDATFDDVKNGPAAVYYSLLHAVMEGNGLTAFAQRDARRTFPA